MAFRMQNDQTGETVTATAKDEADYRAQGYKVLDATSYDAEMRVARAEAGLTAPMQPHTIERDLTPDEQRNMDDARLTAAMTYPDMPGAEKAAKNAENTNEESDEQREQQEAAVEEANENRAVTGQPPIVAAPVTQQAQPQRASNRRGR